VPGKVDQSVSTYSIKGGPTMSVAAAPKLMTAVEMLALPENGVDRWLIQGELREKPTTVRNRTHSRIIARISYLLECWLEKQPQPRGSVLCGEVGVRLRRDPDTMVGVDVIYVSAELAARQAHETTLIDGAPVLAVEILSPSDTQEEINDKVDSYLQAGVALVWIIDPRRRTVQVIRNGGEPALVNVHQDLSAEPHLPGFRVAVTQLFV
jgi:Uma2 family endonuclease